MIKKLGTTLVVEGGLTEVNLEKMLRGISSKKWVEEGGGKYEKEEEYDDNGGGQCRFHGEEDAGCNAIFVILFYFLFLGYWCYSLSLSRSFSSSLEFYSLREKFLYYYEGDSVELQGTSIIGC